MSNDITRVLARFWAKVDRNGPTPAAHPELGPCHLWTAGTEKLGYGKFGIRAGTVVRAHRFVWELTHGPLDDSKVCVCHACDVRTCVNVAHMFLGSRPENTADAVAKGRIARGERRPEAIMTDTSVRSLRADRELGLSYAMLSRKYGVCQAEAQRIVKGLRWAHVA